MPGAPENESLSSLVTFVFEQLKVEASAEMVQALDEKLSVILAFLAQAESVKTESKKKVTAEKAIMWQRVANIFRGTDDLLFPVDPQALNEFKRYLISDLQTLTLENFFTEDGDSDVSAGVAHTVSVVYASRPRTNLIWEEHTIVSLIDRSLDLLRSPDLILAHKKILEHYLLLLSTYELVESGEIAELQNVLTVFDRVVTFYTDIQTPDFRNRCFARKTDRDTEVRYRANWSGILGEYEKMTELVKKMVDRSNRVYEEDIQLVQVVEGGKLEVSRSFYNVSAKYRNKLIVNLRGIAVSLNISLDRFIELDPKNGSE